MAEKKEYIERSEVIRTILGQPPEHYPELYYRDIKELPAADVLEVVHGEWIPSPDGIHPIKCSNCGADAPYRRESDFTHDIGIRPYKSNYCPNCFAKMDGWIEGRKEATP